MALTLLCWSCTRTNAAAGSTQGCSFHMGDIALTAPGCVAVDWFILSKDESAGRLRITGEGVMGPTRTAIQGVNSYHSIFFCPLGTTLELQDLVLSGGTITRSRALGTETQDLHYPQSIISDEIIDHEPAHVFVFGGTLTANNVLFSLGGFSAGIF